jgi:hypothetical protein
MPRPHFTCRNTLERLRESYDERQQKEEDTKKMKIVRVEYMVTLTGEDGKPVSVNKERILSELVSIDSAHIQKVLEEELQATEQPALGRLLALPSSQKLPNSNPRVTTTKCNEIETCPFNSFIRIEILGWFNQPRHTCRA